jgi:hypothetical protein
MKILLQNTRTLNYVDDAACWTANPDQAQIFATGLEAMVYCLDHHMANMQILGEFNDPRLNFTVPVTDLRGE